MGDLHDNLDREFVLGALNLLLHGSRREPEVSPSDFRISVVMPVFNRPGLVEAALDTLRRQTWRKFEVIVVDDASTDRTPQVLARWAARESWLRVVTGQVRSGAAAARNLGLAVAAGDIIAYFDSDNLFYPNALETIAETFRSSPDVWSMYRAHLWNGLNGGMEVRCPYVALPGPIDGRDAFDMNVFAHRRAFYEALGGFDEGLTRLEDRDLIIHYAKIVMPRRMPVTTGEYRYGSWARVSNEESDSWNRHQIIARNVPAAYRAIRVLYVTDAYPPNSQAHIVSENDLMTASGVDIQTWPKIESEASDPVLLTCGSVEVDHGSLTDMIAVFGPDILHVHGTKRFEAHEAEITRAGLPVTVRGLGGDASQDAVTRLREHPLVRAIFVSPIEFDRLPADRTPVKCVPVSFDPSQHPPSHAKEQTACPLDHCRCSGRGYRILHRGCGALSAASFRALPPHGRRRPRLRRAHPRRKREARLTGGGAYRPDLHRDRALVPARRNLSPGLDDRETGHASQAGRGDGDRRLCAGATRPGSRRPAGLG